MDSFGAQPAHDRRYAQVLVWMVAVATVFAVVGAPPAQARPGGDRVTELTQQDFRYGTYIIDRPGIYRLAEDISFNPNSPETLTAAVAAGTIPGPLAGALELPTPVDAYHAGMPLVTQLVPGGTDAFTPGGPLQPRYDPAAYGVGFFAAIAVTADDVVIDLNGHRLEQSPEHALLQRFFAAIELADQPFVPAQGPFDFGTVIDSAHRVTIKNGTIGRSSHHGIHGNGNSDIAVTNVDFDGYEVGAVALNGVDGLQVTNVTATNRKDVPVLGTFSSAQFIKPFVDELVRNGSTTTLRVAGEALTAADIQTELRTAINATHADIVAAPHLVDGRAQIDAAAHPVEHRLFNNPFGVVDGNSYSFLLNTFGVAVNGFPTRPDGVTTRGSRRVSFRNVRVIDQRAFINEVPAISVDGVAAIDPVGAVFQIRNLDFATGEPVTISSTDDTVALYTGNPVANAQAFVAKAKRNGEFAGSHLDLKRLNIPDDVLAWVEGAPGFETLAAAGVEYVCNGDSMFHVNKGVIAYKMDAVDGLRMEGTTVRGLENLGDAGSTLCGDYLDGFSHPLANLPGYGGAMVRGYTFAGSEDVTVVRGVASGLRAKAGSVIGFDVMTDTVDLDLRDVTVRHVDAGWGGPVPTGSPTKPARAYGYYVGAAAGDVTIVRGCAVDMAGWYGTVFVDDETGSAAVRASCPR